MDARRYKCPAEGCNEIIDCEERSEHTRRSCVACGEVNVLVHSGRVSENCWPQCPTPEHWELVPEKGVNEPND